jgi:hypothetical protein
MCNYKLAQTEGNRQVAQSRMRLVLCANSSHAAFSLFALVVWGMLFSNHSDAGEQKSTNPQAALKAACGCGATCLMCFCAQLSMLFDCLLTLKASTYLVRWRREIRANCHCKPVSLLSASPFGKPKSELSKRNSLGNKEVRIRHSD